ncbi:NADPH-dependent oxidoreductase [Salinicoccus sp. ID82-1]|uniref:NADPH-dependent oxidoreductase n=1 Tax=Salinicoccus cyprini TaxID=2493691 RepID=A0A558AUZ5_9STAP|nr:NADPH-dependent oxidoreductase [Salinicoccus cyprini]MCG1010542.1 NADPH-dependent oxidoreductase [Salinicoccus sp. ID82-1]TVT28090.1 NADPH-dependent oxidoreductase [Salinicoccus cyprini]
MNEVIETLQSHRSIRSYTDQPVSDKQLDEIIESVQASPNWINGQQYTIIAVKDKARKKQLAELCGNQKHIEEAPVFLIFCADYYRTAIASEMEGTPLNITNDIDSLIVGATDVGIALGTAVVAAESMGLGTVAIGGIRRQSGEVIDMLELPEYVIPVSGLCIGHPDEDVDQKPRLPKEAVYHEERYKHDLKPLLEKYNDTYKQYLQERTSNNRIGTWTGFVSTFFSKPYYLGIDEMLNRQKFPGGKQTPEQ